MKAKIEVDMKEFELKNGQAYVLVVHFFGDVTRLQVSEVANLISKQDVVTDIDVEIVNDNA